MILATILLSFYIGVSFANPVNVDSSMDWRVVGGLIAEPNQFPFILSLRTASGSHTCGGSILTKDWVVTAAHCVEGMPPSTNFTVVVGANQLDSPNGTKVEVTKIVIHPEWDRNKIKNDVAVLKLEKSLIFSNSVQPIEMEEECNDVVRDCTLAGWGRIFASGPIPNDLQYLGSKTVTVANCQSKWGNINSVDDSQICILTQSGEGACNGDSGGPLIVYKNGKPVLIALVSWGSPCARGLPDVFTRVASFSGWINSEINK